ncbi:MAG: winged helix-turn-helix transcriptional regulator [Chloroflexi bacterium]|jgi:DNA-binding transcriptional ArsR family regulator|nr:winged helix-turn-helix transcriptional regulator [Chloroflexota bacterium]MBT3670176.1 winged helix-turn-helix transcriptional regulator [Chloroflexota bacterium]MBT4004046.1 winged helix-turn-helix transcriptional regulator [Chloroflexota bacterium]MBT4306150.1 winged helix-turn-helix transcriptional regulator [Chloroflexota bacterium]MBT4534530.1 winged helix-turn-helix transcriptional regulator [Chloroflexota bacterium]
MVEQLENINKKVLWDIGTAYDFFISLQILQFPAKVGLRGAWAAGVRSRLPQEDRNFLEEVIELFESPYSWIYNLPKPKDVSTVLYTLKQTPPAERLRKVFFPKEENNRIFPYLSLFDELSAKGSWNETDRENVTREIRVYEQKPKNKWKMSPKEIERFLNYVSAPAEFGEKYLKALQSYYDVFFAEEERRIAPHLENAIEEAKEKESKLSFINLLEDLSQGVRYEKLPKAENFIFVPSFWLSPLIVDGYPLEKNKSLWIFGSRPAGESLVPGEIVPDSLLNALKALSDPTRLRILRYLIQEQLTPAELSRRLRLRAPTVTHHLHALRLSGLVRFVFKGKHERLYFARIETVKAAYANLKEFLEEEEAEAEIIDTPEQRRAF